VTWALIYHDVVEPARADAVGFPGPLAARYKLDPAHFERHLDAIAAAGATVGLAEGSATCALTFDDGGSSALLAAEMLERRGWRGHFFVTSGRIGSDGFLTADGVRELAARGHGVGSHSHTHPTYMGKLERPAIAEEWRRSREVLAEVLGEPPASASVPGGFLSRPVVEEARAAGYELLMTSEPTARVTREGPMTVMGRYTIWATTGPAQAAGYARGARGARARLWAEWTAKRTAKTVAPAGYLALRRVRARLGRPRSPS
jgi:peptidoglycan/xylan/chitin deacetylase (PgdA/CDA1 family)